MQPIKHAALVYMKSYTKHWSKEKGATDKSNSSSIYSGSRSSSSNCRL